MKFSILKIQSGSQVTITTTVIFRKVVRGPLAYSLAIMDRSRALAPHMLSRFMTNMNMTSH